MMDQQRTGTPEKDLGMLRQPRCVFALLIVASIPLIGCTQARQLVRRVNPEAQRQIETSLMMARAHESEGKSQQAEKMYREVLELDDENGEACHRLGVVLMSQGQLDEGLLYLEQANLLLPDQADVLADLGYAYIESGQVEQALPLLQSAYQQNPEDERIINNLAQALGYTGEYDRSFALFKEVMTEAEATANLAYIHAQTGNGAKAMELYSRALDLDPELRPAANALIQLAEMRNKFDAQRPASVEWAARQTGAPDPSSDDDAASPIELTSGRRRLP
jgi:Tfp pilus assembly protein PilF